MNFDISNDSTKVETAASTERVDFPAKLTINYKSGKTPENFVGKEGAGDNALWRTWVKDADGVGSAVTFKDLDFAIIAVGSRIISNVDGDRWSSMFIPHSKIDPVKVWDNATKKFRFPPALWADLSPENKGGGEWATCIIAVALNRKEPTLVEIQAGSLLTNSLCIDAGAFLHKKIGTFGLVCEPNLVFKSKSGERRLMNKDGDEHKGKGDAMYLPTYNVGVFKDAAALEMIEGFKSKYNEWVGYIRQPQAQSKSTTSQEYPDVTKAEGVYLSPPPTRSQQAPQVPHTPQQLDGGVYGRQIADGDDLPF